MAACGSPKKVAVKVLVRENQKQCPHASGVHVPMTVPMTVPLYQAYQYQPYLHYFCQPWSIHSLSCGGMLWGSLVCDLSRCHFRSRCSSWCSVSGCCANRNVLAQRHNSAQPCTGNQTAWDCTVCFFRQLNWFLIKIVRFAIVSKTWVFMVHSMQNFLTTTS